ncbi:MAG: ABC transporter permease subunit, partial [Candidatus Nanopelagicales bacterium]
RLPATLELVLISVVSATVLGVSLGIYAGYRPDSWVSKTIMAVSVLGFSVPSFWVGLILILFFAVHLGWLPAGGRGDTVEIAGPDGRVFARGMSFVAARDLNAVIGMRTSELPSGMVHEVIHRDDLVLLPD